MNQPGKPIPAVQEGVMMVYQVLSEEAQGSEALIRDTLRPEDNPPVFRATPNCRPLASRLGGPAARRPGGLPSSPANSARSRPGRGGRGGPGPGGPPTSRAC